VFNQEPPNNKKEKQKNLKLVMKKHKTHLGFKKGKLKTGRKLGGVVDSDCLVGKVKATDFLRGHNGERKEVFEKGAIKNTER